MKKSNKVYNWDSSNLKRLAEASETTETMIAAKAGLTIKQYRDYLAQNTCPSVAALVKLADIFAVPIDFLVGRCSEKEAETFFNNWKASYGDLQRIRYEDLLLRKEEAIDIPSGYEIPWPYNLYEKLVSKQSDHVLSLDELNGIDYILGEIPEKYSKVIKMHYKDHISCAEIGRQLNYHRETVRAQLSDGIRLMRQPGFIGYIKEGKDGHTKIIEGNKNTRPTITSLELSARAYNALIRAKILYIDELVSSIEIGDLIRNRTIGIKLYNEIVEALNQRYGYEFLTIEKKSYAQNSLSPTMRMYQKLIEGGEKHEEEAVM